MDVVTQGVRNKLDGNLMVSEQFAHLLCAFRECSGEVQEVILEMAKIVEDPHATEDEREAAVATIAEALFPSGVNGTLGIDLDEVEGLASRRGEKDVLEEMDQEEATFADRVNALLAQKGMTQGQLADAIGVGQPAVSMMLSRNCRPQRRTVEKMAKALKVSPEDIWPGFKDD